MVFTDEDANLHDPVLSPILVRIQRGRRWSLAVRIVK